MKVDRENLVATLRVAQVGLTTRELLEQSSTFAFVGESMVTYNGEIFTKVPNPLPEVDGAVPADDLLKLLTKFPDEEVDVTIKGEELRIKGARRSAGITRMAEVALPYEDVPVPDKWRDLPPALMGTLFQAARVCGKDETQPRTTEVHVTPEWVEASDNIRLFRSSLPTKFPENKGRGTLLPAASLEAVGHLAFSQFYAGGGWCHLATKIGHQVSLRCSAGEYPDLGPHLKIASPTRVTLPGNLGGILTRAEVMHETAFDAMVAITIADGELTLRARKDGGWYKESKKVKYDGEPLKFEVHPKFLEDVLTKTRKVWIGHNRLKIEAGETVFVVCLQVEDNAGDEE